MKGLRTTLISILAIGLLAGSAVGVAAQDDLMEPAAATGTVTPAAQEEGGTPTLVEGFGMQRDGVVFTSTWESTDPRVAGEFRVSAIINGYSAQQMEVGTGEVTLENDGGRWTGPVTFLDGSSLGATAAMVLQGEDAYAGLTAYVALTTRTGSPQA